jgi:hypothetical protein
MKYPKKSKKRVVVFKMRSKLDLDAVPFPVPAVSVIPQWYKDMPVYTNNATRVRLRPSTTSPKGCMPVLDALTAGYVMTTPHDIQVIIENGSQEILSPPGVPSIIARRGADLADLMPAAAGFTTGRYIWHTPFAAELPKGYSMLYTHPLNQDNLPFRTSSGIMDSDIYPHSGSLPFGLQVGFEGVIPKGTPFVQLIPIKRESWKSENSKEFEDDSRTAIPRMVGRGYYRDVWWQKKDYK